MVQPGLESIDIATANRAARVARYGEAAVAQMEAAGRLPGAVPPAAGPGLAEQLAAARPAAPVQPAQSMFSRLGARFGGPLARGAVAMAPVAGAFGAMADTQEQVKEIADTTGLDYNSFPGRIGANAANFLKQTGNAATFGGAGALGRGVANVIGGQSFFDPYKAPVARGSEPTSAAVPESVITPTTPASPADPLLQQQADSNKAAQVMQQTNAAIPAGGSTDVPMRNPLMPFGERGALAGTDMERINARIRAINGNPGALAGINEAQGLDRTGITATRDLNGRLVLSNAPGAVKKVYQAADGTTTTDYEKTEPYLSGVARAQAEKAQLGNIEDNKALEARRAAITQATTHKDRALAVDLYKAEQTKQQAHQTLLAHGATEARKSDIEHGKLLVEAGAKGASATEALAKSENERVRTDAARRYLIDHPGDYAGAAAVAAGRSQGVGANTFMPSTTGNDVIVGNRRTGQSEIQTPKRQATEANVSATMAARKMSRAQVIAAYKAQDIGTDNLKK